MEFLDGFRTRVSPVSRNWMRGTLRRLTHALLALPRPHRPLLLSPGRSGGAARPVSVQPRRVPRPSHGQQRLFDHCRRIGGEPPERLPAPPGVGEEAGPARRRRRPPHGEVPQRHFRQPLSATRGAVSVHPGRTCQSGWRGFRIPGPFVVGPGSFRNPGRGRVAGGRKDGQPRGNPQRRWLAHASRVRGHGGSLPDHDSRPTDSCPRAKTARHRLGSGGGNGSRRADPRRQRWPNVHRRFRSLRRSRRRSWTPTIGSRRPSARRPAWPSAPAPSERTAPTPLPASSLPCST